MAVPLIYGLWWAIIFRCNRGIAIRSRGVRIYAKRTNLVGPSIRAFIRIPLFAYCNTTLSQIFTYILSPNLICFVIGLSTAHTWAAPRPALPSIPGLSREDEQLSISKYMTYTFKMRSPCSIFSVSMIRPAYSICEEEDYMLRLHSNYSEPGRRSQ